MADIPPDNGPPNAAQEYARKYAAQGELLRALINWPAEAIEGLAATVRKGGIIVVDGAVVIPMTPTTYPPIPPLVLDLPRPRRRRGAKR